MGEFDDMMANSFFRNSLMGLGYAIFVTVSLVIIGVKWDKITKALKISK
jgi:hypothetical protein